MKDFKEHIVRPREVALYASLTMDFVYVTDVTYLTHDKNYNPLPEGERRERPIEGYVRISDVVTINFKGIDDDTIVRNAVDSLDAEELKAINELNTKIAKIRECKNQLLALTHQTEES